MKRYTFDSDDLADALDHHIVHCDDVDYEPPDGEDAMALRERDLAALDGICSCGHTDCWGECHDYECDCEDHQRAYVDESDE